MNTADFAAWAGPHIPAMARLAARLAPDADRDDVVQEALVRAWRKHHLYDPERGTPSAWLLAITADQAAKARRRLLSPRRPRLVLATDISVGDVPVVAAHDDVDGASDWADLESALDGLTERQRLAVDCFYYAGLTVAETAAVMRCSEGTVKSTLSDARAKLRVLLEVTG